MYDIAELVNYVVDDEVGLNWLAHEEDDEALGSGIQQRERAPAQAQDSPPSPSDDSQMDNVEGKPEDPKKKDAKTRDTAYDPFIGELWDWEAFSSAMGIEAQPEPEVSEEHLEILPHENSVALLDASPGILMDTAGHVSRTRKRKSSLSVWTEAEIQIVEPTCSYSSQEPIQVKVVEKQASMDSFKRGKANAGRSQKKEKVKKPKMYELDPVEHPEAIPSIKAKAQRMSKSLANQARDHVTEQLQQENQKLRQRIQQLEMELAASPRTLVENRRLLDHNQQLLMECQRVRAELHRLQVGSLNTQNC